MFSKNAKNPTIWPFCVLFAQSWTKVNFPGKKGCQFLNIPIIYYQEKNRKKLMTLPEKNAQLAGRQAGRQADRQTDNPDFIGPSFLQ